MALFSMPAQREDGTAVDVLVVSNPEANRPGDDGEPKSVRDAWDCISGAR
jgi:hypothetical protein